MNIPLVEEVDMYYSRMTPAQYAQNMRVKVAKAKADAEAAAQKAAQDAATAKQVQALGAVNARHARDLAKSVAGRTNANTRKTLQARAQGHKAFNKGNPLTKDPMMGWCEGEVCNLRDADFMASEVIPANHFNNIISDEYLRQSLWPADWRLVKDANEDFGRPSSADFGGVLTDSKHGADFSTMIVDEAKRDFGRAPQKLTNAQKLRRLRGR